MRIIKNIKLPKVLLVFLFVLSSISLSAQTYGPLLTDVWGGVNCVDNTGSRVNPTNYYTPSHCSAGCVAISLAQVLNYYEWPKTGTGNQVYNDNYNGSLKRHSAFFDSVEYDYSNMLDEYKYKPSTDTEQEAVGRLMYHTASALQMNFEPSGSTSNVNNVPFVIENFFRFSGHYQEPSSFPNFWSRMKSNIKEGNPVQVAVEASRTGDGHAFVADGYRVSDGKYHVNWGWYNNNGINGWYDLENWTDASPGYNRITGAMFDMFPVPEITSFSKTGSGSEFVVEWKSSQHITHDAYTLEQKVDGGDWEIVTENINNSQYVVNPTGNVYQFRVKAKTNGSYYADSWSEPKVYTVSGGYNGYASNGGSQKSYARQTPNDDLNFTGEYTFETWIKLDAASSNGDVILDQKGVFAFEVNDVTSTNYSIEFTSNDGTKLATSKSGKALIVDEWLHIAVSHSANETKMFVNGELYDSSTNSGFNLPHSDNALNIAERYNGSYSGQINADLDQLRISKVARYHNNFTPTQTEHFDVDVNTITYLTFQNVHGIRYKDLAANLSFILLNNASSIGWNYEETENELSNEDLELIASLITVYPNPVVNNFIEITIEDNDLVNSRNLKFNLFDLNGRVIELNNTNEISSNKWRINFSEFKSGIYILQVDGGNFKMNRKIIIE